MPQMVIGKMDFAGSAGQTNYFATTDNGNIRYQFTGDTLAEQEANVQMLAVYMNAGNDAVTMNLNSVIELGEGTVNGAIDELFVPNNELVYESMAPIEMGEDIFIWDDIVEFGVALLALI